MLNFVKDHNIKPIIETTFALANGDHALKQMKTSPQFGKYALTIEE